MSCSPDKIQLLKAAIVPMQADGKLHELLNVVTGLGSKKVRISVSGRSVLIRRIQLPVMSEVELKSAIRFEAESHIPFPIKDCFLDFQIIGQNAAKKMMNVVLVAAKRDFVMSRLKMLEEIGVTPEVVDVDIFSLMNAFEILNEGSPDKSYGLLNIGHESATFAIVHEGTPFFVRDIAFGGKFVTLALAAQQGVTEENADAIKIGRSASDFKDFRLATEKGLEPLIDEVRHSIDYFENEVADELKYIWISGGGALSYEAAPVLSEQLGKEVALWDSTKKIEITGNVEHKFLAQHAAEMNVAIGLVLRG